MKIICTKQEKDLLIQALDKSDTCIFPNEDCPEYIPKIKETSCINCCIDCLKNRIDWEE